MKYILVAAGLTLSATGIFAQGIAPLTGSALFTTELARDVSLGSDDKNTWTMITPRDVTWSRTTDGIEVLAGATAGVLIDTRTYLHYPVAAGVSQLTETFSQSTTRSGNAMEPGTAWKAERTYATGPASWCFDNKNYLDAKFEVGSPESYSLIIDGKAATIQVTPVVERGWWNRCYSGKRYTRFLVSRELGAVVSIEHIGFTPSGQPHDSSYRMNVKEIKRQTVGS